MVAPEQVVAKQNRLPSGERVKNARGISLPSLRQHYLVAMATSLDRLDNNVQIHHLHVKRFHMVKRLQNRSSISGGI